MKIPFLDKLLNRGEKIPEQVFQTRPIGAKDIAAPASIKVSEDNIKLGERYVKSFFVFSYPRYLSTGWLSPVINMDTPMDVSMFIHPEDSEQILKKLRKRTAEVQSEIAEREEKGLVRSPELETAYQDLEELRDKLQTAREKMFQFSLYITVYGESKEDLNSSETRLRSILESRMIYPKPALFQQKKGFLSSVPYGTDKLGVTNPMNTAPLSSAFPFISFDLSSNEGILYGVNKHNNSLVLFDRFSLENANSVVFGKAGSGKSFFEKLEILRSLMMGTDVIIIDPENEYKFLSDAVGGSYYNMSLTSPNHVNPFDLPPPRENERPSDVLRSNIINLVGLLRIMLGGLNAEEDAIIDQALTETYRARDITPETDPSLWDERTPLMEDFQSVLETMEGAESLVRRLRKFTEGSYSEFFNNPTNVEMDNNLVTFGIRDMEDELRPMAMFMIMRYIWNTIRAELKKRILVVDEAWWMMKNEDGASFLFGTAKRGRKYWLGVTTITQDVIDFMKSDYGKPIITNSSLQLLMKQSPSGAEAVQDAFNLTEAEKTMLLEAPVGEGLFFAGPKHVGLRVVASYAEEQIITTSPEEVKKIKESKKELGQQSSKNQSRLEQGEF
ncbi:MAG: DUF87 domain-containing protein [Candidatus Paceibacterota bacterium]